MQKVYLKKFCLEQVCSCYAISIVLVSSEFIKLFQTVSEQCVHRLSGLIIVS